MIDRYLTVDHDRLSLNFVLHTGTFPNRYNRRSIIQWYFPLKCPLVYAATTFLPKYQER